MPELPEVETVANGVDRRVKGSRILSVWLGSKPEPFKSAPQEIIRVLTGARIVRVRRVGKHIAVALTRAARGKSRTNAEFLVHLGMTGRLLVCDPELPQPAHTHAVFALDSGKELRFVDPRRFGRLAVQESEFFGPGTEPLTISAEDFRMLFGSRKTSIKAALLNQKLLHGVGNIYADESLFKAGIRPTRRASTLTRAESAKLHTSLKSVLRKAILLGGSSVSDYVDADGAPGFFQLQHNVYMRTGKPCRSCGRPIRRKIVAGRGTHYCANCQH